MTPDPYRVLGVSPDASRGDLDQAFRALVRRLHPDTRTATEPEADRRLQELLAAYAILRAKPRTPPAPAEPALRVGPVRWRPYNSGRASHGLWQSGGSAQ